MEEIVRWDITWVKVISLLDAKAKFMKEITVEGADLAFAIGPKILKEFKKEEFPLLISVIEAICENKKLEINW